MFDTHTPLTFGLNLGPSVVIIAAVLIVMLPALSSEYADPYIAGMGAYTTFVFLSVETDIGLFRTIAYILIPLSFVYAAFAAYGEITQDSATAGEI